MSKRALLLKRIFIVLYLLAVHSLAALFIFYHFVVPYVYRDDSGIAEVASPTEETPVPTIEPVPSIEPAAVNTAPENAAIPAPDFNQNADPSASAAPLNPAAASEALMIPVSGIKRGQLLDTFKDARSDNRSHDAIDIMAPRGTPVVAAVSGEIAKFFDSAAGGITIYQYSADKNYVYYYAHLERRADNIRENEFVRQGTVIGYVGDSGNAGPGNYHLHFSVARLTDEKRFWQGEYLNPYPLLVEGREAP